MAIRKPLVLIAGQLQELPAADSIGSVSATDWPVVKKSTAVGETCTVPAGFQLAVRDSFTNEGTLLNEGEMFVIGDYLGTKLYTVWNVADSSTDIIVYGGGADVQMLSTSAHAGGAIRATQHSTAGKWYCEHTPYQIDANQACCIGVVNASHNLLASPIDNGTGIAYKSTGSIVKGGSPVATVATYTDYDVIGVALDMVARTISWYKNGTLIYTATGADVPTGELYMACGFKSTAASAYVVLHSCFTDIGFRYQPPTGYQPIHTLY